MTKKSNVYIGQGIRESTHVMKVGKSNDVKRRQRELPITIDRIAACVSEARSRNCCLKPKEGMNKKKKCATKQAAEVELTKPKHYPMTRYQAASDLRINAIQL